MPLSEEDKRWMAQQLSTHSEHIETQLSAQTEYIDKQLSTHSDHIERQLSAQTEYIDKQLFAYREYVDERTRDMQTELLRGFQAWVDSNALRMRKLEVDANNQDTAIGGRMAILEKRLLEIEKKLGLEPPPEAAA